MELIKPHGLFFAFLKESPKCKCFRLAQFFLWWWGSQRKIQSVVVRIKALLLGQLSVGPNSLWAPFVTVIGQLIYCLVLCPVVPLLARIEEKMRSFPHQNLHAKTATAHIYTGKHTVQPC